MFSEWMLENPSVDFCIGLACQWTTVHFWDGKISTSQKPCRNSERHNHHTVDIRYTKFYMSIYFIFYGGRGVLIEM